MDPKKEIQRKYLEIQLLSEQARQLQQHLAILNQQLLELSDLSTTLKELEKVDKNTEIFSSIGLGIFIKTNISNNNKEVLVNVGGDAVVEKEIPKALEPISKQTEDIKKMIDQVDEELRKIGDVINKSQEDIQELSFKIK